MEREIVSGPISRFVEPGSVVEDKDKLVFMVLGQDQERAKVIVAPLGFDVNRRGMRKHEEKDLEAEREVTYWGSLPIDYLDMEGIVVPKNDHSPALFLRIKRREKEIK